MTSSDRLSAKSTNSIAREIKFCVQNCDHFRLFPGFIPSRLVFVGPPDGRDNRVRLISRERAIAATNWARQEELMRFAALSYCWGAPQDAEKQSKTERHSLTKWQDGVPDHDLSPVLRDAVRVVRKLGIQYLWVDALCIIQDDNDDWQEESSLMGLVYSNAHVTIIPLNSASCQEAFLGCQVKRSTKQSSETLEEFMNDWRCSAWRTRGWTFQEEKLSTRIIFFGPSRIYFSCGTYLWTEGGSRLKPPERSIFDIVKDSHQHRESVHSLMTFWRYELVPQFSDRHFSQPTDKMMALTGIAKYIHDITGYQYTAGLWAPQFHVDLMWYIDPVHTGLETLIGELGSTNSIFVAPSWSWASFTANRTVAFFFDEDEELSLTREALLVSISLDVKPENPFGQIGTGSNYIRLETKLLGNLTYLELQDMRETAGNPPEVFLLDWSQSIIPSSLTSTLEKIDVQQILIGRWITGVDIWLYGILGLSSGDDSTYYRVGIFARKIYGKDAREVPASLVSRIITIK